MFANHIEGEYVLEKEDETTVLLRHQVQIRLDAPVVVFTLTSARRARREPRGRDW
jgi:hypothetical protein